MQIQKWSVKIMETIMVWSMPGTGRPLCSILLPVWKFWLTPPSSPQFPHRHIYQAQWPGPGKFHNTLDSSITALQLNR